MASYSTSSLRRQLGSYQALVQGAALPSRSDRLAARRLPLEEAPWTGSAVVKADLDTALSGLDFEAAAIVFMALCLGGSDWRIQQRRRPGPAPCPGAGWLRKVGDWWGLTAGEVNGLVEETLERMAASLNGGVVSFSDGDRGDQVAVDAG